MKVGMANVLHRAAILDRRARQPIVRATVAKSRSSSSKSGGSAKMGVEATQIGQSDIADDDVGPVGRDGLRALAARRGDLHVVTIQCQQERLALFGVLVVL